MTVHSALTGSELHEPKGADAASANTAYFSDGAGSGTWRKITSSDVNTSSIKGLNERRYIVTLADVSTASSLIIPINETCSLSSVFGTLHGAITGANSALTVLKNGVTSLGTASVLYSGSAKGDDYTISASANSLASGDFIEITTDGASSTAMAMTFILVFTL